MKASLRSQVLPYWYRTLDLNGGYRLADRHRRWLTRVRDLVRRRDRPAAIDKMIVSQSRLIYLFSVAHQLGYSDPQHDYLLAAEHGYRFLIDCMFDRQQGGFYWSVAQDGKLLDGRKFLYGQAMAIYGLVEYYRASGLREPLECAIQVFHIVNQKLNDEKYGGWLEHADEDWKPLERDSVDSAVDEVELKSSNAHLHWLEALSELYDETHDPSIQCRLEETLKINIEFFFPLDPAQGSQFRTRDWGVVRIPRWLDISYGHLLEFAWLMIRAQQVLGIAPAWEHFNAMLDYALEFGFDNERGGFYDRGDANQPARLKDKFWWVQAEGLAALSEALAHQPSPEYTIAITRLLDWILNYQMVDDGIWIWNTDAEGNRINVTKASRWKAGYHEVRALCKFVDVFSKS